MMAGASEKWLSNTEGDTVKLQTSQLVFGELFSFIGGGGRNKIYSGRLGNAAMKGGKTAHLFLCL